MKDLDSELAKGKPKKPAAPWKKPRLDEIGADDGARPEAGFQAEEGGLDKEAAGEAEPPSGPTGFYSKDSKEKKESKGKSSNKSKKTKKKQG